MATWRIFGRKIDLEPEKAKLIALACCSLHNYLRVGRQPPQGYRMREVVAGAEQHGIAPLHPAGIRAGTNSMDIRNHFKHYVNVIAPLPWQTDNL